MAAERWSAGEEDGDDKTVAAAGERRRRSEGCREGGGEECTMCKGRHQSVCEHQPIPR